MLVKINTAALNGLSAMHVFLEVNTYKGTSLVMVGLPDNAVRESLSRVSSALHNSSLQTPRLAGTINFAPADVRKEGTGYDLPLAIGLLAACKMVGTEALPRCVLVGELGLDGSLRPVKGALPIAVKAREMGFDFLVVPRENAREAAVVNRLKVYGAGHIKEVVDLLDGRSALMPTEVDTRAEFYDAQCNHSLDFADVKGQEQVKRACEVAAAGGHNLLLVGSPGCGKSMMAKRVPSILPQLTLTESLETTQIHSVAGKLAAGSSLITQRPFRSPHHTISDIALIGGGSSLQPGEISLAHNGVLFLDELPEFNRSALETLRQPLEDRAITISRAKYTATLPCSFMLVAAMNPCPCGYYNHPTHDCDCSPGHIQRYMNKISGPLLDRIDLQVEVTPVPLEHLTNAPAGELSAAIRERVVRARAIQTERFRNEAGIHCNAQMPARLLERHARPDEAATERLRMAMKTLNLSARAYERILKVARTIADLDGAPQIGAAHVAEAVGYRNLDRASWGQ
ncbi:competence protein ComM [Bacteroidaceae bacterium]|jgi:magnesium chelatase family protein|nr:competence protein ComM [Bacteroidaceae bacterium]